MFEKIFKIKERKTNIITEILAGITIFATGAYVLAVIPAMLSNTGLCKESVFVATCLGSGLLTIAMGIIANIPVLMAPGLGITAYFAVVTGSHGNIDSTSAIFGVLIAGVILMLLTITNTRRFLFNSIPLCLKNALMAGIGLFIMMIGMKVANLVVVQANICPSQILELAYHGSNNVGINLTSLNWNLALGDIKQSSVLLSLIGLLITTVMIMLRINGAILIGLILTTIIGIPMGVTNIDNLNFSKSNLHSITYFDGLTFDIAILKKLITNASVISVSCIFAFIGLMDNSTNLMAVTSQIGMNDIANENNINSTKKAMLVDSIGVCIASFLGIPFFVYYLESLAGIGAGGRTGLTAITVGILFILALILSPIFLMIPPSATAPALIIVGIMVISSVTKYLAVSDFSDSFPSILAMALMPFTFNIADSVSGGVIYYVLLKIFQKKHKDVHWIMYIFTVLIVARYVLL